MSNTIPIFKLRIKEGFYYNNCNFVMNSVQIVISTYEEMSI